MTMAESPKDIWAFNVMEDEEIVQYIHPNLLRIDYVNRVVQIKIILATFFFVTVLFTGFLLVCNQFSAFRCLALKHQIFMSLAVVRGVYGIICIFVGVYAIFKTTNLDRDVVFGKNATSSLAMCLTVGFFLFELTAVVFSDIAFKTFSKMLLLHHGLALIAYSLAIKLGANYAFGCKGMILEMSTPFSCLCYVLLKAGLENSKAWVVNQMILIHTFHLRSVVECHLWVVTYQNWDHIYTNMPTVLFALLYLNLTLITFIMTPYWGYKKTQQLFNPVDWNFQEERNTDALTSNGSVKKTE